MGLNAEKVLEISINTDSKEKILEYLRKYLRKELRTKNLELKKEQKPLVIVTPNPEQVVLAHHNPDYADILNRADVALPDGIGLIWAVNFLNRLATKNHLKRIPGVELMENLVSLAEKEGFGIGLIGGRGGVAVETFECLRKKHPKLKGWAEEGKEFRILPRAYSGQANSPSGKLGPREFRIENGEDINTYIDNILSKIKEYQTAIVFVGLGAPKQEYLTEIIKYQISPSGVLGTRNIKYQNPLILMSVGGSFDYISGRVKRAPLIIRNLKLEWLYRLIQEPWRWRRQLSLIQFVNLVVKEKFRK
jgi:N-acetylglucosaminyldiphosphoundecaprenol N-acetyl-beta-D-mannosaminyltransferase